MNEANPTPAPAPDPIPLARPSIGEAEIAAVVEVLRSGRLSLGPELPAFEAAFAERCGTTHAIAVSSGTDALHFVLRALDIGPGHEVIVPSFSFVATATAVLMAGAKPVFVDVEERSLNLDPSAIEGALTEATRAILPVHVFGRPARMDAISAVAQGEGLMVIEDACEAPGATFRGLPVGALGDAACFGFYPNKTITTGEGGMITTDDAELAERLRRLRNQGRTPREDGFEHVELGYNGRLSDLACALGRAQLARLDELMAARQAVATLYEQHLQCEQRVLRPAATEPGATLSWFVYVVQVPHSAGAAFRDALVRRLMARGIGVGRYFAPIHQQPLFRESAGQVQLPVTERVGARSLALPFWPGLDEAMVARVVAELRDALDATEGEFAAR